MRRSGDKDFPIYQNGGCSTLYTLHTAVYDWEKKTVTIYEGNPILGNVRVKYDLKVLVSWIHNTLVFARVNGGRHKDESQREYEPGREGSAPNGVTSGNASHM